MMLIASTIALILSQTNPYASHDSGEMLGAFEMAYPYPSPDGSWLVFQGNFEGRWQIYTMDLESGAVRRAVKSTGNDIQPSVSPDGKLVAFISDRGGTTGLFLFDRESGDVRALVPTGDWDGHPKWSADGEWIIFNRTPESTEPIVRDNGAIFKVRPNGADLIQLTDTARTETFPSFAPDGQRFVYVEWYEDEAGTYNRNGELIVVDPTTNERQNITASFAFDGYPHWGPSGEWIYFSSSVEGPEGREMVIFRIRPDGSEKQQISATDGLWEVRAIPSADEKWLYYNLEQGGRNLIYRRPIP